MDSLRSRLRSEPIAGVVVMVFAFGFLFGVLAGQLRDGSHDTVAAAGGERGSLLPGNGVGGAMVTGEGGSFSSTGEDGVTDGAVAEGGAADGGGAGPNATTGAVGPDGTAGATDAGATPVAGASGSSGPVRGVTDTSIKLGIACLDLGALKAVPQYNIGDNQTHFTSVLEGWKRAGLVPVHGRDIELAQRCFSPLSAEDQRSTAVELVRDRKVFAVGAMSTFRDGSEIVSQEFQTPILSVSALLESSYQRGRPFFFTFGQELTLDARNFAHWLKERGLAGKKIGIYYLNDQYQPLAVRALQDELATLGNRSSVAVGTDNLLGGPSDAVAVQRFRSEGVEVVALLTSPAGFIQAAQGQRYKPQYVQADFAGPYANDTATATYDGDNFDGALIMTSNRTGEQRAGTVAKQTKECQDNYAASTGRQIDALSNPAEWGALTHACDVMNLLYQALSKAGRGLTPESFIRAMEAVQSEGAQYGNFAFSPTKHHGGASFRTLVWKKACRCWNITAPPAFRPFFLR